MGVSAKKIKEPDLWKKQAILVQSWESRAIKNHGGDGFWWHIQLANGKGESLLTSHNNRDSLSDFLIVKRVYPKTANRSYFILDE